jgi:hypothetical protein
MIMRRLAPGCVLLLSACATTPAVQPPATKAPTPGAPPRGTPPRIPPPRKGQPVPAPPPRGPQTGGDKVIGKDARGLVAMFGPAIEDVREPGARKLQFGGAGCILDAYLYAPSPGREPVTTYVDARLPDGRDTDRAACIMTLSRGR